MKKLLDQAIEDGGVVCVDGGVMMWRLDGTEAWTGPLWVHPDHRRQGLGTGIVKEVATRAKAAGATHLNSKTMKNRDDVTAFYRKMGRTIVGIDEEHIYWRDAIETVVG